MQALIYIKKFSLVSGYFYRTLDLLYEMHFLREMLACGTSSNFKIRASILILKMQYVI